MPVRAAGKKPEALKYIQSQVEDAVFKKLKCEAIMSDQTMAQVIAKIVTDHYEVTTRH